MTTLSHQDGWVHDGSVVRSTNLQSGNLSARSRVQPSVSIRFSRATQSRRKVSKPKTPGIALSTFSDSGVLGDGKTTFATVALSGQTSEGAVVKLRGFGQAIADDNGKFEFENVPLALGTNEFRVVAWKGAKGKRVLFETQVKRVSAERIDPVIEWNANALRTIVTAGSAPPVTARNLAIVHAAVFDAVNSIQGGYNPYKFELVAPAGASADAAAIGAAYQVLVKLYPKQKATLDTYLSNSLITITDGQAETDGLNLGKAIGDSMITLRSMDGAGKTVVYTPETTPGKWRPTAPEFKSAALPQWKDLTCFTMTSASQFRPAAPPALTSRKYAKDINQVKALGRKNSRQRTADETESARFWADEAGSYTPPGHWNQLVEKVAASSADNLLNQARTFALLNISLADAGVTAWDAKYTYSAWRPIDAVQNADTDGNRATKAQKGWQPLLNTPNHPDYVSGHSTFSGAAAQVLTQIYGKKFGFTTNSVGLAGVERSYKSFNAAADEAGMSRVYGGIHTMSANEAGLASGRALGRYVVGNFLTKA
jgi:PAP2 superfamily